ncbi:MAG: hypothetical protein HRT38_10295 [Alteromonadaceae bacterium]|nr:hypothetical protein [Alteromonadaceae bacterium]
MITANNERLVLPTGTKLVMLDKNGNILKEGHLLEKEVFKSIGKALAKVIVDGARVLTKSETQIYSNGK